LASIAFSWFAAAQPLTTALARVAEPGAVIRDDGQGVVIEVPLTQSVPWRVFTLDQPARLVVEFSEVVWETVPSLASSTVIEVETGRERPGWSRLVAVLREPLVVDSAEMTVADDGRAMLTIALWPTTADDFRATVLAPNSDAPSILSSQSTGFKPLIIALDPGHGGVDPGAQADDLIEADLMLSFARALKEDLVREGTFEVILTREDDVFVPLEERMTRARSAGADVFLSLHADALEADAGSASGMTVYTLSDDVSEAAARRLAERHAQDDILTGVDLGETEDEIAIILVDLAQRETAPRSDALAATLVNGFLAAGLAVNSRPNRHGGFAVLKAADMPSVLIELGFLSSKEDRERLTSDTWQAEAALAIRTALTGWAEEDALWLLRRHQ
jgi:N-acetylmuramoyl-L-alanine amidase